MLSIAIGFNRGRGACLPRTWRFIKMFLVRLPEVDIDYDIGTTEGYYLVDRLRCKQLMMHISQGWHCAKNVYNKRIVRILKLK